MTDIERAQLIPVSGANDQPDSNNALPVQFNPTTLKVALSNTLKENERSGSSRATQYVDKSSSTLTVELIFDTTDTGEDVRRQTRRINEAFMILEATGEEQQKAPKRCRFQWGAFAFVGIMGNFDEALDFFSPEGQPLRSTVSIKLAEDRYQHLGESREAAQRETPMLTATGGRSANEDGGDESSSQQQASVTQAQSEAGGDPRDWRRTALFNGVESPRLPGGPALSIPRQGPAGSARTGFRFGASGSLGTGISGAFGSAGGAGLGMGASSSTGAAVSASAPTTASPAGGGVDAGNGFD